MQEDQSKPRVITFNEVKERLKGVKLENMSAQDMFDRYIVYGTVEELNSPEIQKRLIEYGYLEYLVNILDIITESEILIEEISKSPYMIKRGTIENTELIKDNELPRDYCWLIIDLLDENRRDRYKLKYIYSEERYKTEFKKAIGKEIQVIVEDKDREIYLLCFLEK